jgi:hypothetical protein
VGRRSNRCGWTSGVRFVRTGAMESQCVDISRCMFEQESKNKKRTDWNPGFGFKNCFWLFGLKETLAVVADSVSSVPRWETDATKIDARRHLEIGIHPQKQ